MSATAIKRRILRKGRGSVFTPSDFLALGSRAAVDQALSRLVKDGTLRRLTHGVYDYPKISPRIGPLSPDPDAVAKAIAAGARVQVTPARAANLLGLTTQVPAKSTYLTDGPSRTKHIGTMTITLKKAAARNLVGTGKPSGLVFQALRYVGKDGVNHQVVSRLARALSPSDAEDLVKNSFKVAGWMRPIAKQIAQAA